MNKQLYALAAVIFITFIVYLPGLSGGFMFDDYPNILKNHAVSDATLNIDSLALAADSGIAGPLKRPVAMLSFALNTATSGTSPQAFKLTNLLIHLLNGVLVYLLSLKVLGVWKKQNAVVVDIEQTKWLSLAVMALWLLHPINLSTTLYVVQRMTSLSATFSLLALLGYCVGRERLSERVPGGWKYLVVLTPLSLLLGVLSKENAILVIPLIALIEVCFFRFRGPDKNWQKFFAIAFWTVTIIGVVILAIVFYQQWAWLENRYQFQPFTLVERLITETRVIWFYLSLVVFPRLTAFALYHDDFVISTSLLEPLTSILSCAGLIASIAIAAYCLRRRPMVTFAIGWFLVAHSLESSFVPLDLIYEHRNYLPTVGLLIGLVAFINYLQLKWPEKNITRASCLGLIFIFAGLTFLRANSWSDPITLAIVEAQNHPQSFRSVYAAGRSQYGLYLMRKDTNDYVGALEKIEQAAALNEESKLPLIGLVRLSYDNGYVPKEVWVESLIERLQNTTSRIADISALGELVRCRADKERCKIPASVVKDMYEAAYTREFMKPAVRAQLLVDFSALLINDYQDPMRAIDLLKEAINLAPNNYAYRKMFVGVLVLSGEYGLALNELERVAAITRWKDISILPEEELTNLEQQIRRAMSD